jgi:hypothetical protein
MRKSSLFFLLSLFISSLSMARPHFSIRIIKCTAPIQNSDTTSTAIYQGYGYDILNGGKPFIHQSTIPAVPGNQPFKTRKQAKRVARLVKHKLKKGIMPPTVSIAELQVLNVIGK